MNEHQGILKRPFTRFATLEEVMSEKFMAISKVMDKISVEYDLPEHSDINQERYPWSANLLSHPSYYAARMWEYPFAILSAQLQPRMRCVDVGCGRTPFTVYLKRVAGCEVVGVDPDIFETGTRFKCHGVSRDFIRKSGLAILQGGMEDINLPSCTADRVFCLSVIEHVKADIARRGVQEMARLLKPGGRLIITVDVNMHSEISRPLDLIWESGLVPLGEIDLRWPARRFGILCDGKQPADVFGITLIKQQSVVETQYSGDGAMFKSSAVPFNVVPHSSVPLFRRQPV